MRRAAPARRAKRSWRIITGGGARGQRRWSTGARWRPWQPSNPEWPIKIAQAIKDRGDIGEAERILIEAREKGLASDDLDIAVQRYQRLWGRSNSAIADAEATVADPEASQRKLFFAAFYLLANNRLDEARSGLQRVIEGRGRLGAVARGHLGALELLAIRRAEGLPDIPGALSAAQSSIEVRAPGSDTLVVGFALPEGTIGLSVNAAHAMLSSKGVNGLYLYDSRQLYHLAGSDRLGPGWEAMISRGARLRRRVGRAARDHGRGLGDRLRGAIRAGLDLGTRTGSWVFSPA